MCDQTPWRMGRAVGLTALLGGCALSVEPIILESDAIYDPALLGTWETVHESLDQWRGDDSSRYTISRAEEDTNAYLIEHYDGFKSSALVAQLSRISGHLVLEVSGIPGFQPLIAGHLLLALEVIGPDEIHARMLNAKLLDDAMEAGEVQLARAQLDEPPLVLTDSATHLREQLTAYLARPGVLKETADVYRRVRRVGLEIEGQAPCFEAPPLQPDCAVSSAAPDLLTFRIVRGGLLQPGDPVRLVTGDGTFYRFEVTGVDVDEGLVLGNGDAVRIADIIGVHVRDQCMGHPWIYPAATENRAYAAARPKPHAAILVYGLFAADGIARQDGEDPTRGPWIVSREVVHLETTTNIRASVGELFGFKLELTSLPVSCEYTLRSELHHPPVRQPDGNIVTRRVREQVYRLERKPFGIVYADYIPYECATPAPVTHHVLWSFAEGFEHELVPGQWTHKVYVDGEGVACVTFDVGEVTESIPER
jgi:hypothetical protein